jgi:hypothetical protein
MIEVQQKITLVFEGNFMLLTVNGIYYKIPVDSASAKLKEANQVERDVFKISPSGYGIHWPLIDEDLSIEKLLKLTI